MIYYLNISYDEKTDEYFAFVDDGTKNSKTIYQIDDTREICDYISSGRMNHIDDVSGLESFLKAQTVLKPEDSLKLNPEILV